MKERPKAVQPPETQQPPPPEPATHHPAETLGPTLTGWDPMSRLPNEPLIAYATFRQWERDYSNDAPSDAAAALDVTEAEFTRLSSTYYWQLRLLAIRTNSALELTPRPWAVDARILAPLPEDAAEFVRRREWAASAELVAAAVQAIREWRASEKPPTIADLVKLLDSATRLARLAAGMPQEGPAIASALNSTFVADLNEAINKAYPEATAAESEASSV